MKRNSDGGGPREKRARPNGQDDRGALRLLIPSKVAGSIIGKGGRNITSLRSDFSAQVQVPDCSGPERVVTISGTELETYLKIVERIIPSLEDQGKEVDLRLLLHQSLAGCVIGKGGSKVKELREKTNAKIKIFGTCCPRSTDRVVSIIGKPEVAVDGLREVLLLIKDTPQKGYAESYNPEYFEDGYAEEYGGFGPARVWDRPDFRMRESSEQVTIPKDLAGAIIGKGGMRIRRVRGDSGADITIDEPLPGSNDRIITIKGTQQQIQLAQYLLQQSVRESQRY
ncbi:heterogeneous nuclear ribonucleoprotein K-like [Cimex lectularius]|uniref:K Homology domain-containing protein n=1 Tax=Cimex lectularius TaxID=79782 RepID=A0A8I6S921_CIMLE|nr:heterogeneous nuclear ribonucleoprotein K-like [Cimex lectularius]XP_014260128.1 heterogeneous nuclear ribonucleoprotein K-like [Cimex lectularius]XP_014260129.1 heterogeneous nuclear ribonucleoprotein K-like [Cimex lectularius]XP_014260130.1 heterogeneous nuclear ribonucleoprotein K-like [Cimex lectularius]XP_014260131.1 heterogeneous nuclear ribonucleoprotein K-like [Cimex lectularius]